MVALPRATRFVSVTTPSTTPRAAEDCAAETAGANASQTPSRKRARGFIEHLIADASTVSDHSFISSHELLAPPHDIPAPARELASGLPDGAYRVPDRRLVSGLSTKRQRCVR